MAGVAFDRLYKVRDQIGAAFQLHLNIGPAIFDESPFADELIIDQHGKDQQTAQQCEKKIKCVHSSGIVAGPVWRNA
jgi:hypothetical protein